MQFSEVITIGENMWIRSGDVTARTKLEDLLDAERFAVSHPTYRLLPLELRENQPVDFMFSRDNGMFSFSAVFEKRVSRGNVRFCVFRAISEVEKNQRRLGYRLAIVLDAVLTLDAEPPDRPVHIKAKTINISTTGALFAMKEPIEPETAVSLRISLRYNEAVMLNAQTVRVDDPTVRGGLYGVAVKFIDPPKNVQSRLGRFIMQRQILQRQAQLEKE